MGQRQQKPLIGITTYYVERSEINNTNRVRGIPGEDMTLLPLDYSRSIEAVGGVPVVLPVTSRDTWTELLPRLDGLLLIGGEDVDPRLYGQRPQKALALVNPVRDCFESALLRQALQNELPILGICRGLQLINVICGGTLHQDLPVPQAGLGAHAFWQYPKGAYSHDVHLQPGTYLQKLYQKDRIGVNSFHHQGIDRLGKGLMVAARAEDGLVEAVEGTGPGFLLAVQWHPETMTEYHDEHLVLFAALTDAAVKASQKAVF